MERQNRVSRRRLVGGSGTIGFAALAGGIVLTGRPGAAAQASGARAAGSARPRQAVARYARQATPVPADPDAALEALREGNRRFVDDLRADRDLLQEVQDTRAGQNPFAVILSCMDSRTGPELVFDQGIGSIFSIRVAGNVVNDDVLGSMEYACAVVGTPLVVVLGHTGCGAVKGAIEDVRLGNLTSLLNKIRPAVDDVTTEDEPDAADPDLVQRVTERNVELAMDEITGRSTILNGLLDADRIAIVGGMYDVATGAVAFIDEAVPVA
jgi:carbonic anhydrase